MFESLFTAELSKRVGTFLVEVQTDGDEVNGVLARVSGDVLVVVPITPYALDANNPVYISIPSINFVKISSL